jgi:hypothetical protein
MEKLTGIVEGANVFGQPAVSLFFLDGHFFLFCYGMKYENDFSISVVFGCWGISFFNNNQLLPSRDL